MARTLAGDQGPELAALLARTSSGRSDDGHCPLSVAGKVEFGY